MAAHGEGSEFTEEQLEIVAHFQVKLIFETTKTFFNILGMYL